LSRQPELVSATRTKINSARNFFISPPASAVPGINYGISTAIQNTIASLSDFVNPNLILPHKTQTKNPRLEVGVGKKYLVVKEHGSK